MTAAAPAVPPPLFDQLAEGGRLVIPVGQDEQQELLRIVKARGRTTEAVPLRVPVRAAHRPLWLARRIPRNRSADERSRAGTFHHHPRLQRGEAAGAHARAHSRIFRRESHAGGSNIEIIVVDDGSTDGTARVAQEWMRRDAGLAAGFERAESRQGLQRAARNARSARARSRFSPTPIFPRPSKNRKSFSRRIDAGNDVAIGSRAAGPLADLRAPVALPRNGRHYFQRLRADFHRACRFTTRSAVSRRSCASRRGSFSSSSESRGSVSIRKFCFSRSATGLRTAEVPVRWAHDPATKVHVFRDSLLMFGDLIVHPLELAAGPLSQKRPATAESRRAPRLRPSTVTQCEPCFTRLVTLRHKVLDSM